MRKFFSFFMVLLTVSVVAENPKPFADTVGPVSIQPVVGGQITCPFMSWGSDVATILGNGSLTTQKGSIYDKLGVNITLYRQDDVVQQVKDYMGGKTPFLRGTLSSICLASEIVSSDPATKPVIVLFESWSLGDHFVARSISKEKPINNLNDLKKLGRKVKIAVQDGGAHVGMLYQILDTAGMTKNDVEFVWAKELAGKGSASEVFAKDPTVDACFAITPDMAGLISWDFKMDSLYTSKGSGAEGSVVGAKVIVSTQSMLRAIPDVLAVRADWYAKNKPTVEKIVAGFLTASSQIATMRADFDTKKKMSPEYKAILTTIQKEFAPGMIPAIEVDGHGLLLDCQFTGLTGQISFFEDKSEVPQTMIGQMKNGLDMAQAFGYIKSRRGFDSPNLNYENIAKLAGMKYERPDFTKVAARINAEAINFNTDPDQDSKTIASFTISFEPNNETFSIDQYRAEFEKAIKSAGTFGNAVVVVRGHSDPTQTLKDFLSAGMQKGLIKRNGSVGSYQYYFNGKPLDVTQTANVVNFIKSGDFDGADVNPKETMQAALNLSLKRAGAVKASIEELAKQSQVRLDLSQIQPVGVGVAEPVIAKPRNLTEAKQNMRVELRIVRVASEAIKSGDFDY